MISRRLNCAATLVASLAMISCRHAKTSGTEAALQRFEFEQPQMGVPFRIVLYSADAVAAERAANGAFDRVKQLNAILSDYETDSELSELSRASGQGKVVRLSGDLRRVLEHAQRLAALTEGAFDVTVGPYVSLWRRARRLKQLPETERLVEARGSVGFEKLILDRTQHTARLLVPNMKLDLGGIAKGYAVDEAMKVLRALGIKRALVGAVGDIRASEPPPGERGWRVAIAPFDRPDAPVTRMVLLRNAAVSTSGDAAQRLEFGGQRYSHIVDPRTGIGLTDHSLVTVIAHDSMTADSLATAVSVLGPQKGLALLMKFPGAEARVVREVNYKIEAGESSGFKRFYKPDTHGAERKN